MTADAAKGGDRFLRSPSLKRAISLTLGLVTLVFGTALPVLTGPRVSTAWVNVIWGSIYGLGFWISSVIPTTGPGVVSFILTVFGVILWPMIVLGMVYKVSGAVFRHQGVPVIALIAFFLLSFSWNAEIGRIRQSFVYYLPLYSAFMDR